MNTFEIGIDMGGTHTGVGLVRGTQLVDKVEFDTDLSNGAEGYASYLCGHLKRFIKENSLTLDDIESIGMGVPGSVNRLIGRIEYANNLGFENVPFQELLSEEMGIPVLLENDANLAAYGEYILSESKAKTFMCVTIGTGIGAGMIYNGEIYRGVNSAEGEVGHMTIKYDGIPCNCGRRGCFEAYASANALAKMAEERINSYPDTILKQCEKINGKAVFEAFAQKDKLVTEVMEEYTSILSEGFANIINIVQPEELVIGGGISASGDLFIPETIRKTREKIYSRASKTNTLIRAAKFANDAGIMGAAKLR